MEHLYECISLLVIKGEDKYSYVLYHVTGGAKLELLMLGVNLTTIERIKESLQECYLRIRNKSEIIYELIDVKQEQNETSMKFSDKLLKLGRELQKVENQRVEIVVEEKLNLYQIKAGYVQFGEEYLI